VLPVSLFVLRSISNPGTDEQEKSERRVVKTGQDGPAQQLPLTFATIPGIHFIEILYFGEIPLNAILVHFLVLFFFLPPGVCVCHGLEEENHGPDAEHVNTPGTCSDLTEDEDPCRHPHGCPSVKQFDGQIRLDQTDNLTIDCPFLRLLPCAEPFNAAICLPATIPLPSRELFHNSGPPLYVTLRTLLI
jgi:hypothetical protein